MAKPFLSVGIIFKNEIRCLERCLRSLMPLREAVPCEVVMADTGSDDGSRAVAEKYADVLIDFPWINDFAAARNAVMDRCTGRWYLSLDADEWLDDDIRELVSFVRANNRKESDTKRVLIRNHMNLDNEQESTDFYAPRLLRLSTGVRFHGAIHETWRHDDGRPLSTTNLRKTLLHHDGYIGLNTPAGAAKRQRNQAILAEELEKDPENVRLLIQYVESSRPDPQHVDYIRRAIAAVEAKKPEWESFGPPIYRYAVLAATERNLPELEEWIDRAEELFPNSFYTAIDVSFWAVSHYWDKDDYAKCVHFGEQYMKAIEDYDAGRGDQTALLVSTLHTTTPWWRQKLRILLGLSCSKEELPERAAELLVEAEPLDSTLVGEAVKNLRRIQSGTERDTAPYVLRLYERISGEADEGRRETLWAAFLEEALNAFAPTVREMEKIRDYFCRYSYTAFLPLAGKCELGNAAAVMETEDVREIENLLGTVEKWGHFPVSALIHALEQGAPFPPAGMGMEEMDRIATRLAQYKGRFFDLVCRTAPQQCSGNWRQLLWARSMVIAAVQDFDWRDEKRGLALAETFSKVVGTFVSRCYTQEVLCDENIQILPPFHRFGWYCGRAFQALEAGDAAGYARLLRAGLESCPEMKVMVEFLTEHTPELKPPVSGELLALAEQVRTLLSGYAPDDPVVLMMKQSPAYQKVAHLIEGPELGVYGGVRQ